MSVIQQILLSLKGTRRVGSITVNSGGSYFSISGVSITGGGGSGATATPNTYVSGTYGTNTYGFSSVATNYFKGYDCTALPTGYTLSPNPVGNWSTPPTVSFAYRNLYGVTNVVGFQQAYGTGYPNGTYNITVADSEYGLESASITVTVLNNVVTNVVVTNPGLSLATPALGAWWLCQALYTSMGNGIGFQLVGSTAPSTRKGVDIIISGGVISSSSNETVTPVGGTYTNFSSTGITLAVQLKSAAQNLYSISSVTVNNSGSGYTSNPTVSVSGSVYSTGAVLTANLI